MGKGAPEPPDPAETAGAQTANNIGTAIANQVLGNVNQVTPTGSLTYYFNGPDGQLIAPGDWTGGNGGTQQVDLSAITTTSADMQGVPRSEQSNVTFRGNYGSDEGATAYINGQPVASSIKSQADKDRILAQYGGGVSVGGGSGSVGGGTGGGTPGAFQYTDPNTGNVYDIPQMTAVQELSPEEQAIFDAGQATRQNMADLSTLVSGQMNEHFATPFSLDGLPEGGSASNLSTPEYSGLDGIKRMSTRGPQMTAGRMNFGEDVPTVGAQIADSGEILREFGDAGEITRSYGRDYSEDRRRVEEALMSRLNPSLARDKETLRTSLLNQGIREGSEAFDRAMNRANEQATDARFQAILAGGQEQTRMDDMEARRAGFENAAQQQAYNQLYGRAAFSNAGQQQLFGQNQAQANLDLQAGMANQSMALDRARLQNQGLRDMFSQDLANRNFTNNAIGMNNSLAFQEANFGNNLADRSFANDQTMQNRMDADRQRALQETLMMRNQPINEIGALLGTGQVSMPNFVNTNGVQMPTVDRAGLEMRAYEQELANWQQQQAMMGSIFGTAGNLAAGGLSGGYF